MWWYGRGNSGGAWLPEEKKANMWHEREIVGAQSCWKRKKIICGKEGKIVVAHGRLPSPAPPTNKIDCTQNFPALDWLFDLSKQHS